MEQAQGQHTAVVDRPWLTLVVILSATFVQLLNASIVYVAVPGIQDSLTASDSAVQFVLVGYQLGFAGMLVTGARLGDIFGRRRLFLVGMGAFTVLSVVCSASPTIGILITARVLQGVASGLMFPQVLSFVQVLFRPEQRGAALGAYGATIGFGSILGPTIGGALIQAGLFADPWRAIFLVNVPVGIAAVVAGRVRLPESAAPDRPRLDLVGAVLSAAGLGLILYALGTGGDHTSAAVTAGILGAGLVVLVVFVVHQRALSRAGRFPVLDPRLFDSRAFSVGMAMSFIFYAGVPAFFLVLSLYLLDGQGFTPLLAGLATLPYAVGTIATSATADKIAARLGRGVLALGAVVLLAGMAVLLVTARLVGDGAIGWWVIPGLLLGGLGFGLFIPPLTDFVLADVPADRVGPASGALTSIQQVGGAVGVTIISIIFFGVLDSTGREPLAYADAFTAGQIFLVVVFAVVAVLVTALPRVNLATGDPRVTADTAQHQPGAAADRPRRHPGPSDHSPTGTSR